MVTDLVGDDIRLREVPWGTKTCLKFAKKCEVDVEFFVTLAVKRAHCRLRYAAGGAHLPVIQNKRGSAISGVGLLKYTSPTLLRAAEHLGNESPIPRPRRPRRRRASFALWRNLLDDVDDRSRIESKEIGDERNDDAADAQSPADAHSTTILNVGAGLLIA